MAKHNSTPPGQRLPKNKKPTCKIKQIKVHSINDRDKLVPWIRIQGRWLDRAGFQINTPVQIHVMDGYLIFKAGE